MSMKIYISTVNESWVVDRFRKEWYKYNSDISTKFIKDLPTCGSLLLGFGKKFQ